MTFLGNEQRGERSLRRPVEALPVVQAMWQGAGRASQLRESNDPIAQSTLTRCDLLKHAQEERACKALWMVCTAEFGPREKPMSGEWRRGTEEELLSWPVCGEGLWRTNQELNGSAVCWRIAWARERPVARRPFPCRGSLRVGRECERSGRGSLGFREEPCRRNRF